MKPPMYPEDGYTEADMIEQRSVGYAEGQQHVLQEALTIVCGNWDAWQKETEFEYTDRPERSDVIELIARIITDIQSRGF